MIEDANRDLGRLEGEMAAMQRDVTELKSDVKSLLEQVASAKGGWKVLAMAASLGGTIGAGVAKLATWATTLPIK